MTTKIGKTCDECHSNCCTFGTGKKVLPVRKFLENYMTYACIDTSCENLTSDLKCNLWGTPKLPIECRCHVCHNREFNRKELSVISSIEENVCAWCKCEWMVVSQKNYGKVGGYVRQTCEVCGHEREWTTKEVLNGEANLKHERKKRVKQK